MPVTENFAEYAAPLAKLGATAATTEQNTAWINLSKYHRAAIVLHVIGVGTTLDMDIEIATDDAATGLFTFKSITQLDSEADGDIVVVDVRADELGKPSGASAENYDWLRVEITPSGSSAFSCVVYGLEPRYAPIDQTLWAEAVD